VIKEWVNVQRRNVLELTRVYNWVCARRDPSACNSLVAISYLGLWLVHFLARYFRCVQL